MKALTRKEALRWLAGLIVKARTPGTLCTFLDSLIEGRRYALAGEVRSAEQVIDMAILLRAAKCQRRMIFIHCDQKQPAVLAPRGESAIVEQSRHPGV